MTTTSSPRSGTAFLDALFAGCDGLVELRTLPPGGGKINGRAFLVPQDDHALTTFFGAHLRDHLYFGVATRRNDTSGTLENCARLPALFVDCDFKTQAEALARHRLVECPLPPSIVIHSGGGLHVYWLLREPLNLQDQTDRALACSLLRRLVPLLGADPVSAEPAHVLRVPGSSNFKYDPSRPVVVELLEPARRYNLSEFDEVLPAEPVEARVNGTPFVAPERILDGDRNNTLFREARSLKAKGFSRGAVAAAIREENTAKCAPPLPERELAAIVDSAWSQADRQEFAPSQGTLSRSRQAPSITRRSTISS